MCGCFVVAAWLRGVPPVAATMKKESSISICYEYTVDLESSGLSMRVQVPPLAPEFARTFPAGPRNVLVFCGRASRRNASVPCPAGRHGTSRHPGAPPGPRGCRQLGGSGVLPAPAFSGVGHPPGRSSCPPSPGAGGRVRPLCGPLSPMPRCGPPAVLSRLSGKEPLPS